jgi:hypothetical protein
MFRQVLIRKRNLEQIENDFLNEISQLESSKNFDKCKIKD